MIIEISDTPTGEGRAAYHVVTIDGAKQGATGSMFIDLSAPSRSVTLWPISVESPIKTLAEKRPQLAGTKKGSE